MIANEEAIRNWRRRGILKTSFQDRICIVVTREAGREIEGRECSINNSPTLLHSPARPCITAIRTLLGYYLGTYLRMTHCEIMWGETRGNGESYRFSLEMECSETVVLDTVRAKAGNPPHICISNVFVRAGPIVTLHLMAMRFPGMQDSRSLSR